jgi:hypothetical protein
MKFLGRLEKAKEFWFLLIASFVFFFLRFPSLFEPDWYGDEGIYQVLGMGIRQGRLLYKGIFDNKPPLLYVFYSFVNGDLFWIRFLNLLFGLGALITFFYLSKKLFNNKYLSYFSTIIFGIFFGLPIIEANIANAENFMLLPIILGALLLINKGKSKRKEIIAGLLIGIAFLFKIVAVFDFAAFLIFIIFTDRAFSFKEISKEKILAVLYKIYPFVLGFIIPIFLTFVIFAIQGNLPDFIKAAFFSNIGYVGYGNNFIIPQGLLILKLLILAVFIWFIYFKREKLKVEGIFIYLWFAFSMYNAFFSERPYTHYILVLLPSFCLLLAYLFDTQIRQKLSDFRKHKSFYQFFLSWGSTAGKLIIIGACLILIIHHFWFFTKTGSYYKNFFLFVTNNESVISYQGSFDKNTPFDYEIAGYIKSNTISSDSIFLWGNNSQLYKLTDKMPAGKYAVAYHITNFKDGISNTKQALEKTKPKFIIIMKNAGNYPFSLADYALKINIGTASIYERIF